ncbi:chitinase N-terminal domain-containing protein, partial [Demequina sp. SYSU T00192]
VLLRIPAPDASAAIDAIGAAGDVTREAYSASSLTALDAAVETATAAVADVRSTQAELDSAAAAIDAALAALEEIGYVPLDDYRIAVLAGQAPELPATLELLTISEARLAEDVAWEDVEAEDFDEPYAVVEVHGVAGATDVVLHVEVVPAGLAYFVDAGAAVETTENGPVLGSPVYDVVSPLAALRNPVVDAAFDGDADEPWGLATAIGDGGVTARAELETLADKDLTAWEAPDGTLAYRFWLPAGSYEVTTGHSVTGDAAASLVTTVTHEGVDTSADAVVLDADVPTGAATVAFTTYRDAVVTVTVEGEGGPAMLSWLGIVDTTEPEAPGAATAAPGAGVLSTDNGWDTGLADGDYTLMWDMWWGQGATTVAFYEDDRLVGAVRLDDATPASQHAEIDLAGRVNGTYTYVAVARNAHGVTTSEELVVEVTDAAPGQGVLSHDNHDRDGDYTVTFNLWWGTNGTTYRLYEDGVLVDEQELTGSTPDAQTASTALTGRAVGRHTYVAELVNAAGTTATKPITVTVR